MNVYEGCIRYSNRSVVWIALKAAKVLCLPYAKKDAQHKTW